MKKRKYGLAHGAPVHTHYASATQVQTIATNLTTRAENQRPTC